MEVFLTVISGTIVFSLSQWLLKFIFEPAHELKKSIGEVEYCLIYYANCYSNPKGIRGEYLLKSSDEFRQRASRLLATANGLEKLRYRFLSLIRYRPSSFSDVREAASLLIGISNNLGGSIGPQVSRDQEANRQLRKEIREDVERIRSLLGIAPR